MDWTTLLFSFKGRMNRAKYWLVIVIFLATWVAFFAGLFIWLGGIENIFSLAGGGLLFWLLGVVLFIVGAWAGIATGIKRLHDREKSAWWILVFWILPGLLGGGSTAFPGLDTGGMIASLAGMAISIWGFVELCCLRGTQGPNVYGPDPLA